MMERDRQRGVWREGGKRKDKERGKEEKSERGGGGGEVLFSAYFRFVYLPELPATAQ